MDLFSYLQVGEGPFSSLPIPHHTRTRSSPSELQLRSSPEINHSPTAAAAAATTAADGDGGVVEAENQVEGDHEASFNEVILNEPIFGEIGRISPRYETPPGTPPPPYEVIIVHHCRIRVQCNYLFTRIFERLFRRVQVIKDILVKQSKNNTRGFWNIIKLLFGV